MPENIVSHARNVQQEIRKQKIPLRWVRPESIHLTLKFFGEIEPEKVEEISGTMTETAKGVPPIKLGVKGIGFFPNLKKPRIMWMGLTGDTPALNRFQVRMDDAFAEIGFPKENRRFKAHLTIARIKGRINTARAAKCMEWFGEKNAVPFSAKELVLMKSDLKPSGAVYTPLKTISLI